MKRSPFLFLMMLLVVVVGVVGFVRMPVAHAGLGTYPEIFSISASPDTIQPGESSTLSWAARGAASVVLEWAPEGSSPDVTEVRTGLPAVGTMKMTPGVTTIYTLRCETAFSGLPCMSATAKVEVKKK
jgi:hypothetical protein